LGGNTGKVVSTTQTWKNAGFTGFFIYQHKESCMKNFAKWFGNLNRARSAFANAVCAVPLLLIALVAVIGFSMAACDNGSGSGGGGGNEIVIETNPFIGTWTGDDLTLVLTDSTWFVTTPDGPMQGTYTRNGNSGSFYMNGQLFGTAAVLGNTMLVNSTTMGQFTFTKGGGSNTDAFTGTWVNEEEYMKIVASNGTWIMYKFWDDDGWIGGLKGTYTVSGNTANIKVTHVNTSEFVGVIWTPYASLPAEIKQEIPQTMTGTLNGNTFTVMGIEFTKEGSGGGSDAFTGTWVNEEEYMKIVASNGTWIISDFWYDDDVWMDSAKGTYTVSGNTANIKVTHVNINEFGGVTWTPYASLPAEIKQEIPQTMTGTLNGNTFTISQMGIIFIKEDSGGGGSTGGTFTLTGIPAKYIGKYAVLQAFNIDYNTATFVIGAQDFNMLTSTGIAVPISGGSVSLPMWTQDGTKYSGSGAFNECYVDIYNSPTVTEQTNPVAYLAFGTITFTNGSASKTWNSGELHEGILPGGGGTEATDLFAGTWNGTLSGSAMTITAVHESSTSLSVSGTWKAFMGGIEVYRGTYITTVGMTLVSFQEVNVGLLSGGESQWKNLADLTLAERVDLPGYGMPQISIYNNQFTLEGSTFTKQTG
jgi:hypothetical protein